MISIKMVGTVVSSDELPSAHFNFIGWTDTPAPPPERIDIDTQLRVFPKPREDTSFTNVPERHDGLFPGRLTVEDIDTIDSSFHLPIFFR